MKKLGPTSVRQVVLTVVFFAFLLLTKACSNGRSNLGMVVPIFGDLGAFLGYILLHVGTLRRMLGLS